MKKMLFIATLLFGSIAGTIAQEYEDLLALVVNEEFEKARKKAGKYMESDKTKKDPLPYLYFAEASYRMSLNNKYANTYPKAFKEALSYAGKFRKKDKNNAYKEESREFFEELKVVIAEEVENYWDQDSEKGYKRALSLMKKVATFDPDDRGAGLMRAILEILTGNKSEGRKMLTKAWTRVEEIGTGSLQFEDMTEQTQYNLKVSLMRYSVYKKRTDLAKAQSIISFGHQYFYEENEDYQKEYDEDFKTLYDELHN